MDFFRFGTRYSEVIPGWSPEDTQAIEYNGRNILILMNYGLKSRTYNGHVVPPGECLVIEK